jgi:hypothetical protein
VTTSRRALVLVITLLLVMSQQAALLHALSHLGEVSKGGAGQMPGASATAGDTTTAEDLCGDCLAYSQIATLAPTPAGTSVLATEAASSQSLSPAQSANAFSLFALLARAPPALL